MRIEVKDKNSLWGEEEVCVVRNGICNHAAYDPDEYDPVNPDRDSESVLVCRRCGAWRYTSNNLDPFKWNDEVILEES